MKTRFHILAPSVLPLKHLLAVVSILICCQEMSAKAWHQYKTNQSVSALTLVDPCLGETWEIVRIPKHPEWPAHMNLVSVPVRGSVQDKALSLSPENSVRSIANRVIRTGDRVLVNQNRSFVHAQLEGRALSDASVGQSLLVRLSSGLDAGSIDHRVISVDATGEGTTSWDPSSRPIAAWGLER